MSTPTITLADLQVLMDIAKGFMPEAGAYDVGRYADPTRGEEAIANAKTTVHNAIAHDGITEPESSPFQERLLNRHSGKNSKRTATRVMDYREP